MHNDRGRRVSSSDSDQQRQSTITPTPGLPLDPAHDPLRVLASTQRLVRTARHVGIDAAAIAATAARIGAGDAPPLDWRPDLHPADADPAVMATLVLVLDALNFCFWPLPTATQPRWQITWQGETHDGYWALAVALRRALAHGYPLANPAFLAGISEDDLRQIVAPDPGCAEIPLLHARLQHLHEVGTALQEQWDGTFLTAIQRANGSAVALLRDVLRTLPSFRDVQLLGGRELHFYKRAQILIADLVGAFNGGGPGAFHDLHALTAFADYKVPQVLRRFGILAYSDHLAAHLQRRDLLPSDSIEEIEIRAATVWAVELLRQALAERGHDHPAWTLDGILWHAGQTLPGDAEPYHRTLTVWY